MATIHDRETKPDLCPLGNPGFDKCYLGVELEVEPKKIEDFDFCVQKIEETLRDFVILKNDYSLIEGFEICSRPATLDIHKEKWKTFFENAVERLKTYAVIDGKRSNNCGMHVHINRSSLSDLQIGKIITFIHREENYNFIRLIAGRESNDQSNYKITRNIPDAKHEHYCKFTRKVGVNLHNKDTIEIRIFNSTLDYGIFLKNLEFCQALVKFTAPSHVAIADSVTFEKFLEFIQKENESYKNLISFLRKKNYIESHICKPIEKPSLCLKS